MKIRTSNNKPKIIIAILVGAVIVGGASVYAYTRSAQHTGSAQDTAATQAQPHTQQSGVVNYNPPTSDQQSAGSATKSAAASQAQSSSTATAGTPITVTIQGGKPRLTTLLDIVTNDGTCTLTLTGPTTTTLTSNIQAQSSYSVCTGFDTSNLAAGKWTAKVDVQADGRTGTNTFTFTAE